MAGQCRWPTDVSRAGGRTPEHGVAPERIGDPRRENACRESDRARTRTRTRLMRSRPRWSVTGSGDRPTWRDPGGTGRLSTWMHRPTARSSACCASSWHDQAESKWNARSSRTSPPFERGAATSRFDPLRAPCSYRSHEGSYLCRRRLSNAILGSMVERLDGRVVRGRGRDEGCGARGRPALSRSTARVGSGSAT